MHVMTCQLAPKCCATPAGTAAAGSWSLWSIAEPCPQAAGALASSGPAANGVVSLLDGDQPTAGATDNGDVMLVGESPAKAAPRAGASGSGSDGDVVMVDASGRASPSPAADAAGAGRPCLVCQCNWQ